jgi:hypothetical protein
VTIGIELSCHRGTALKLWAAVHEARRPDLSLCCHFFFAGDVTAGFWGVSLFQTPTKLAAAARKTAATMTVPSKLGFD